jgi:apolipoprotein D and lipocalin family protein
MACSEKPIRPDNALPLTTVEKVDLEKYLGTWYEIASRPNRFQKDCVATKATYKRRTDGDVSVFNECREKALDGKSISVEGKAWPVDASNTKFKVRFFWPFKGDYWIVELGKQYEYAVVAEPRGRYVWILSRTTRMEKSLYDGILQRLKDRQYDVSAINLTPQP